MASTAFRHALDCIWRSVATVIVAAVALAAAAGAAHALPAYLTAFEAQYPAAAGTRIDTCTLCHTDVPALNPYGAAFAAAGHEFAPIESADSDGDGFSNLEEITGLSFPGNPNDTPAAVPSVTPTSTAAAETETPTTTAAVEETPTVTPNETATPVDTSTPAITTSPTQTGTVSTASPTGTTGTGTFTPATGSPTRTSGTLTPGVGSPTRTTTTTTPAVRTPTITRSPRRTATSGPSNEDDGCAVVAPEHGTGGGALALLLVPALLVWARRRW